MGKNYEIGIDIGDTPLSIVTPDQKLICCLKKTLILSQTNIRPNFTVKIDYLSSSNSSLLKHMPDGVANNTGTWKKVHFGNNEVKAYYRWFEDHVEILFEESMKPFSISYIYALLVSTFYALRKEKKDYNIQDILFIHAAGIVRDDSGYVFTGPSGSGKSTVSRLSQNDSIIINDECVQLNQNGGEYWITNTPLRSDIYRSDEIKKKLKAIFFLIKDSKHCIKKINNTKAAIRLIESLVYPANFYSNGMEEIVDKLELVYRLANKVPCYELHFAKNNSFWNEIDRLES